ncbi:hypothetical protein GALMADRAFT_1292455 [Galerina marginata CBS 339.88]|uniref:Uncharacterized protein n=1 Tax=Galerina marginata (strain CBS 339.88) TaxID=685588 RepID=A0A067S658_GALM3|nr:hypothetical protein GALMADRAFT_1292455 [Galerina marginata CBS 339.88]
MHTAFLLSNTHNCSTLSTQMTRFLPVQGWQRRRRSSMGCLMLSGETPAPLENTASEAVATPSPAAPALARSGVSGNNIDLGRPSRLLARHNRKSLKWGLVHAARSVGPQSQLHCKDPVNNVDFYTHRSLPHCGAFCKPLTTMQFFDYRDIPMHLYQIN